MNRVSRIRDHDLSGETVGGEGAAEGIKVGGLALRCMDEEVCRKSFCVAGDDAAREGLQVGDAGDYEMTDFCGKVPTVGSFLGGGGGISESRFFDLGNGLFFDLRKFHPATGLEVLTGEDGGGFLEIEIRFHKKIADSQKFARIVIRPFQGTLDGINREDPAKFVERQLEEESCPEEFCSQATCFSDATRRAGA